MPLRIGTSALAQFARAQTSPVANFTPAQVAHLQETLPPGAHPLIGIFGGDGYITPPGDQGTNSPMTTFHFIQGKRYAAGIQAPAIPLPTFISSVDLLPGFSGAQVYPAAQAPLPAQATTLAKADYVLIATRSDPSGDVELPPGVLWVIDLDATIPIVPGAQPGSAVPGTAKPADNKIFGLDPMVAGGLGLAAVVAIYLVAKKS